ncbi:ATP-binding protein [Streptomyces sp. M2CJ-2]|uniref:ATP-binding protein n=1 Tax=Streptomyces sp. M2CJ-2 TaxID=2803948 RepID=UPI00192958CC|nr:ATP-binding protein [Streptomyces sp. M2CJ-2]MBL3667925.1 ATP-binding protein [Streptomyces sp. M2CJ-2]
MKQSAAKTLGVAVLGAAFAVVGAGAASAAPAVPNAGTALDTVAQSLPAEDVSRVAPGADGALQTGQDVVGTGMTTARPVAEQLTSEGPQEQVDGLLGGLPATGLPKEGVAVNGVPLG